MVKIAVLGIDLGKNVCSLAGLDETGHVVLRRRMNRGVLSAFVERLAPCIMAMEACCGAHHSGRNFAARQHQVRLMSPEYVQPWRPRAVHVKPHQFGGKLVRPICALEITKSVSDARFTWQ